LKRFTRRENWKYLNDETMHKKNSINYILPAIYGLCIFLFFWKYFPYHLHFQEQFQLFLFTKSYFIETCSRPGGFCNYAGRFFTQFYISSFVGALLVSCFLTGIQQLVYAIARRFRKGESNSPQHSAGLFLSFLPALFYWYLFCDENSQTGGIVALLLTLIVALVGTFPKSHSARRVYLFASIPVLYWLAGGTVILSVLLLIWYEWRQTRRDVARYVSTSIAAISFAISLPFISKYFLVQYTIDRYWWGVDYVHFVIFSPFMITYLWITILLVIAGALFLPKLQVKRNQTRSVNSTKSKSVIQSLGYSIIQILALLLVIYFVILKSAYPQNLWKEEVMAYDYHCRMQNWDKVIEMANRKSPTVPITVTCLNLALYKTGQLPNRMFDYFQNGPEGLLPTFQRDFMIPMVGGEPYWYLGFVNTAQRFAFEAMESFPDYQKSARAIKRLAETNLVNGYYEAASKYLYLLENTLFYRKWAKETRTFLYNEAKIDTHSEWGKIRRFQTVLDFLFSEKEKDKMLGVFFQQHLDNRMAYEYLMTHVLLAKNIRDFPVYFRLKKEFSYPETPKSWQEALVYIWGLTNNDFDSIPVPISQSVKQQVVAYANIYTSMESPESTLQKHFSKTYWYYFHFRDYIQTKTESQLQY
jgi:hypothetical protein